MSYSVIKTDNVYHLLEKESDVIIELDELSETKARAACRKLNLGAGFNGWTPLFIAKNFLDK